MASVLYTFKTDNRQANKILRNRDLGRDFVKQVLLNRDVNSSKIHSIILKGKDGEQMKVNLSEVGYKNEEKIDKWI